MINKNCIFSRDFLAGDLTVVQDLKVVLQVTAELWKSQLMIEKQAERNRISVAILCSGSLLR